MRSHSPAGRSEPSAQPKSTAPTLVQQESACTCGAGDELTSLAQVARRLHVARSTAYVLVVERQEIPYVRILDRVIRVQRSDLEAYLEANRQGRVAS